MHRRRQRKERNIERLIVGYWLAAPAVVTNAGCAILALTVADPEVFLIGWAGTCFSLYALIYYIDTGRLPMGFRSLAMQLRWDITSDGDGYQPGQKLPSVIELAKKYNTTNTTTVRALRVLADEGLVYVVHGRGTYYVGADKVPTLGEDDRPILRIARLLTAICDRVPPGHPIPSEQSLCNAYRVDAGIVNWVLQDYSLQGLIRPTAAGGWVRR